MDEKSKLTNDIKMGFERYIKSSVEDVPLIRPPRRHMVAQVTCGLKKLYDIIKEAEAAIKSNGEGGKRKDKNGDLNKGMDGSDGEKNKTRKQDDEGGGDEEEETSPYTDEEGEFVPDDTIPLLASRYKYVETIARGQSALIIKALDTFAENKTMAIKVLHRVYKPIGGQEADILLEVHRADPWLYVPFARLQNQFIYGPHYCLVFEFLSPTPIYTHYDKWDLKGPNCLDTARKLCIKLSTVMGFLHKQNVIHADLKPENILLSNEDDASSIMVIDFGNALRNTEEELSLYYSDFELQTLLYRAPEVIFGLKFSLEIDMWSFGCLLAECYTGEPLFMAKTKHAILEKITELLGPFPKEFGEGECAEEFMEFIGRPLSIYKRVENLRKRLDDCVDNNFLLLLEKLLTYSPGSRITPFQAACHPFVACATPFLYLTSSMNEERMYPTVLFDSNTYPFLPKNNDEEEENPTYTKCRKRLAQFSRSASTESKPQGESAKPKEKEKEKQQFPPTPQPKLKGASESKTAPKESKESKEEQKASKEDSETGGANQPVASLTPSNKLKVTQAQQGKLSHLQTQVAGGKVSRTDVKQTLKSMGLKCEDFTISVFSKDQTHAMLKKQGVEVTNHEGPKPYKPIAMPPKSRQMMSPLQPRPRHHQPMHFDSQPFHQPRLVSRPRGRPPMRPSVSVMRSDVPHGPIRPMVGHRPIMPSVRHVTPVFSPNNASTPKKITPNPPGTAVNNKEKEEKSDKIDKNDKNDKNDKTEIPEKSESSEKVDKDKEKTNDKPEDKPDDDDDCIILDDSPPLVKRRPNPLSPRRFPQQFQLMGTTVQVNRGTKRPMRGMQHHGYPPNKRHSNFRPQRPMGRMHPQYFYNDMATHSSQDESSEASVQDTLKRLQNYNISITCRRNSKTKTEAEEDGDMHPGSDDDDMSRFLSCELDEQEQERALARMEEEEENYEFDSSSSIAEASLEERHHSGGEEPPSKDAKEKKSGKKLDDTVELQDEDLDDKESESKEQQDSTGAHKDQENKQSRVESKTDLKEKRSSDEGNNKSYKKNASGNMPKPFSQKMHEGLDENGETLDHDADDQEVENSKAIQLSSMCNNYEDEEEDDDIDHQLNEVLQATNCEMPLQLQKKNVVYSEKFKSPLIDKINSVHIKPVTTEHKKPTESKGMDDDDINEELEKQLLESGGIGDEFDAEDLGNEALDNLEMEGGV